MDLTSAATQKKRAKIDARKSVFFIFIENARDHACVYVYMCVDIYT